MDRAKAIARAQGHSGLNPACEEAFPNPEPVGAGALALATRAAHSKAVPRPLPLSKAGGGVGLLGYEASSYPEAQRSLAPPRTGIEPARAVAMRRQVAGQLGAL